MNKIFIALACLLAAGAAHAQKSGDIGVGVVLGAPTAVTGKLWFDGTKAVDAGLGCGKQS